MNASVPGWASQLAQKYMSKTINHFILHGNVRDLVMYSATDEKPDFIRLSRFLGDELFGSRNVVLYYDRAGGIHFRDSDSRNDFYQALPASYQPAGPTTAGYGRREAEPLPRNPAAVLALLEKYFRIRLEDGKSVALVIDYAETIAPNAEAASSGPEDRTVLVNLLKWAQDPIFLAADFTVVLVTQNLADLNRSLVQSPYNSAINIGFPDYEGRLAFIHSFLKHDEELKKSICGELEPTFLAQQTAGLGFIQLKSILAHAQENSESLTRDGLSATKKELIEAEAHELLEFVETSYTLDQVAGHTQVKKHLRDASAALRSGNGQVLPMGYLVCGPVGTGKTFLVNCFSGEVGIPMVKLKNFRSQWQGVTEGNLEKILTLLDAMAPVAVMIDEADAYLGDRAASGDSGVSSRVFAKIASFMSNTANRGRIIWFLMTARPDLMPVDLKRQGRAEEHLALFYPDTEQERIEVFEAMKVKTGMKMTKDEIPALIRKGTHSWSGADMEAALTRARFRALAKEGNDVVSPEILEETLLDFIPPTYPQEVELQTLLAVRECTSRELLPERFRKMDSAELNYRIEELKI
ncbi:MAG: AAA family ATPase [Balneolales bacterium]|nr:AAA family ATPase [Balneolales bacterium]